MSGTNNRRAARRTRCRGPAAAQARAGTARGAAGPPRAARAATGPPPPPPRAYLRAVTGGGPPTRHTPPPPPPAPPTSLAARPSPFEGGGRAGGVRPYPGRVAGRADPAATEPAGSRPRRAAPDHAGERAEGDVSAPGGPWGGETPDAAVAGGPGPATPPPPPAPPARGPIGPTRRSGPGGPTVPVTRGWGWAGVGRGSRTPGPSVRPPSPAGPTRTRPATGASGRRGRAGGGGRTDGGGRGLGGVSGPGRRGGGDVGIVSVSKGWNPRGRGPDRWTDEAPLRLHGCGPPRRWGFPLLFGPPRRGFRTHGEIAKNKSPVLLGRMDLAP